MAEGTTPSQTIGPFFGFALPYAGSERLVPPGTPGTIEVEGTVFDGEGAPVPDAMIEICQADPSGRFPRPMPGGQAVSGFLGFGRSCTGPDGRYHFVTVKPGAISGPDGRKQAPHIEIQVFARGLLRQLATRMYFPDEGRANAADPILAAIAPAEVRSTLIARAAGARLRFDIHLQGEHETAFFVR